MMATNTLTSNANIPIAPISIGSGITPIHHDQITLMITKIPKAAIVIPFSKAAVARQYKLIESTINEIA